MKKILFLMMISLTLSACSVYNAVDVNSKLSLDTDQSISNIQTMSSQQLLGVSNNNLCVAYYQNKPPQVKKEIERRGLISEDSASTVWTWDDINSRQVKKGMSLCSVLAALGKPNSMTAGNQLLELDYPGQVIVMMKDQKANTYRVTVVN
ncbi:MAG: hypothetical protein EP298_01295 [Gammaproteobacteria bacterium]|nr:MAG: hypothetical protein EP298_01295 [Gammaproteobacteria bacterium]UTW41985.1 hypothetical protein KFE69_10805 [bacterium SCSIO 12844]